MSPRRIQDDPRNSSEGVKGRRRTLGKDQWQKVPTIKAINALVDLYDAWDTAEPGKGYAEKAAKWRAKLPQENGE